MARLLAILLITILLTFPVERALAAERRVALVVGVGAYEAVPSLPNAVSDANAMADLLRKAGFDVVTLRKDVGNLAFKRAVREFQDVATDADMAVVYYAGHGIEVGGQNYVVPSDAKLADERDIEDETVSIERLTSVLESAKSLRLLILDACRNNPFGKTMKRRDRVATRAINAGLGSVEPSTSNTLIAYAAKGRAEANDGDGGHSPFTQALLNNIATPGLDIRIALGRVRDEVLRATHGQQEPYVYGSLGGDTLALVPAPQRFAALTPPKDLEQRAREDFESVKDVNSKAAYEAFLKKYPDGLYAAIVRDLLARLGTTGSIPEKDASSGNLGDSKQSTLPPVQPELKPMAAEQKAWNRLKDSTDLSAIRKFIDQYPLSPLTPTAQERADTLERLAREQEAARRTQEEAAHLRAEEEKRRKAAELEQKRLEREAAHQKAEEERAKALEAKRRRAEEIAAAKQHQAEEQAKAAAAAIARKLEEEQTKAAAAEMQRKRAEEDAKIRETQRQQAAKEAAERKRAQEEAAKAIEAARLAREATELAHKREAAELERQERARAAEIEAREKEAAERASAEQQAAEREKAAQEAAELKREAEAAAKAKAVREAAEKERLREAQELERQERAKAEELAARDRAAQEEAKKAELERQRAEKQELAHKLEEEQAHKLQEVGANSSKADTEAKRREAAAKQRQADEKKEELLRAAKQREAAEKERKAAEKRREAAEEAVDKRRVAAEMARQAAARQAEREKVAAEKRRHAAAKAKEPTKRVVQSRPTPVRVQASTQPTVRQIDIDASRAFTRSPF